LQKQKVSAESNVYPIILFVNARKAQPASHLLRFELGYKELVEGIPQQHLTRSLSIVFDPALDS
jgi:hypothetical protein